MRRKWMQPLVIAAALAALAHPAAAQQAPMTPLEAPPEPDALPLDTGGVIGSTSPESWFSQWGDTFVRNVTTATLTPVLPEPGKATGAAAIVAPGGGFMFLSMSNEGWEVARALADRGVAAFVLKYRVRPTASDLGEFERSVDRMFSGAGARRPSDGQAAAPVSPSVLLADQVEDSVAAFAMVRDHSAEWGVDPDRIGMIGFSAGAMTAMTTALSEPEVRPAFLAPIYGATERVEVPESAPPLFVALAADDPLFANRDFGLVEAWRAAGRPVEFHLYQNGGHGFGLGNPDRTSNGWIETFMRWLDANGLLKAGQ